MQETRLDQVLSAAARQLTQAGVDSPRLTAELLLAHALTVSRVHLLAHLGQPTAPLSEPLAAFQSLIARCSAGEPLAYLLGNAPFYDLELACDPRALIPRPETELLVETILEAPFPIPDFKLADVGTGTGCIAITVAVHCPAAHVYAIDLSPDALALARHNAERTGVHKRITFLHGDLLDPLPEPVHVIAANLPYVSTAEWQTLPPHIHRHEPRLALDGGADGLDLIRRLLAAAPAWVLPGGLVVLEIGAHQGTAAAQLAHTVFPHAEVAVNRDYAGLNRLVVIRL